MASTADPAAHGLHWEQLSIGAGKKTSDCTGIQGRGLSVYRRCSVSQYNKLGLKQAVYRGCRTNSGASSSNT